MRRSPATRAILAILAAALIVAGCSSLGPSGSAVAGSPTDSSSPPTGMVSPSTADPTPGIPTRPAAAGEPPTASLAVEGGDPVPGQLGSYTWNGGGSDSPWLPGTPITVGGGERLLATLDPGVPIDTWSARQAAAGSSDGARAVGLGDGSGLPIVFVTPGRGRRSIQLTIHFAGNVGSAAYYWDVTVR